MQDVFASIIGRGIILLLKRYTFITILVIGIILSSCQSSNIGAQSNKVPTLSTIELPYPGCSGCTIIKNNLIAAINEKSDGCANRIISYNKDTQKINIIYESQFTEPNINGLTGNDKWLLWVDGNTFANSAKIMVQDLSSGEIETINCKGSDLAFITAPALFNNYIAWVEISENHVVYVYLYNLFSKEKKVIGKINKCSFYNSFVDISDNKLLWTDCIDNKGYYFLYDLKTGSTSQIECPYKYPGYAKLANNRIYSINFNNYDTWTNQYFGMYDLDKKSYIAVLKTPINMFCTNNNYIAVIDQYNKFKLLKNDNNKFVELPVSDMNIFSMSYAYNGSLLTWIDGSAIKKNTTVINIFE